MNGLPFANLLELKSGVDLFSFKLKNRNILLCDELWKSNRQWTKYTI